MAYTSVPSTSVAASIWAAVSKAGETVLDFMVAVGQARSRAATIEALNGMTDAELKERFNIKREDITRFVFRDHLL